MKCQTKCQWVEPVPVKDDLKPVRRRICLVCATKQQWNPNLKMWRTVYARSGKKPWMVPKEKVA